MAPKQEIQGTTDVPIQRDKSKQGGTLHKDHDTSARLQAREILPAEDHTPNATNYDKGFIGFLRRMGCCILIPRERIQADLESIQDRQSIGVTPQPSVEIPIDTVDQQRETEKGEQEQASSSADKHYKGWQGSSSETLKALLERVIPDISSCQNENALYEAIKQRYIFNDKQEKGSISNDDYKASIKDIKFPEGLRVKEKAGYVHVNQRVENITEDWGRFSLNIKPDDCAKVFQQMVEKLKEFPYILDLKALHTKDAERLDTVIVFFCNPANSNNKDNLEQSLHDYKEYTRPSHPAMMEPIKDSLGNPIEGIAFAYQTSGMDGRIGGWGRTRIGPIMEAIASLKKDTMQPITIERLLPEVKKAFIRHGIDPENPYLTYRSEQGKQDISESSTSRPPFLKIELPSTQQPEASKPVISPLKLDLAKPSVVDTDVINELPDNKGGAPLDSRKDKALEILRESLEERDAASYQQEVKEINKKYGEFRELYDISYDLEAYARKNNYTPPSKLREFRQNYRNLGESIKKAAVVLTNDGKNIEALSGLCQEMTGHQKNVDLCRECYRTEVLAKQINMNWVDDKDQLAVGGLIDDKALKALQFAGVSVVVDVRTEKCDNKEILEKHGIKLLHLPIDEYKPVKNIEDLKSTADQVKNLLDEGKYVLIHCREGLGRSPLVANCVQSLRGIDDYKNKIYDRRPGSHLKAEQAIQVEEFERIYGPKPQKEI